MLEKDKTRADRILKSRAARIRRKEAKKIIQERTENLFCRLRKKRKRAKVS